MASSSSTTARGNSKILLLDGGMGTTLESQNHNVSTPLWGCDLLLSNPGAISAVHTNFLEAGSDLIETATYQLTLPGLMDYCKVSDEEGRRIMRSAVHIAYDALGSTGNGKGVVLSLGPYGATLSPGQEYTGLYPYPYGPQIRTNTSSLFDKANPPSSPSQSNYLSPYGTTATERLAEFHYDRLLIYALDPDTWSKITYIAFETIPLTREIEAIRKAMWMLNNRDPEKIQVPRKKFWISSAWPRGVHPQMDKKGEHVRTEEVWRVMSEEREGLEKPFGIGVNCTGPEFVRKIVTELTDVARRSAEDHREREEQELKKLAFVLYPDGGSVYDVVTRTWTERTTEPSLWAKSLMSVAKELEESGVWEQIIIGGCCKAGFEEIRSLRAEL